MAQVVELKMRNSAAETSTIARFVLNDQGAVTVVGLTPMGTNMAEDIAQTGIPGPDDAMLKAEDGLEFLIYLHEAFRGSRFWATQVLDMEIK